jgi:ABC-2 type transport system permease protein
MDLVYYGVNFAFFKILYLHTPNIGGWDESQAMIFVGCFIFIDAINMTIFSNNTWMLPLLINKGDLDYYLVRPISSFFMVNFRDFAFNSFINLIMAGGLLGYALFMFPHEITLSQYLIFTLLLINGAWIFHLVRLLFILPVFWTQSGRGFEPIYWSLVKFAERPHRIFTGWLRLVLLTILPFILMSSYPVEALFDKSPWYLVLGSFLSGFVFLGIVLSIWRMGIRDYSSASS